MILIVSLKKIMLKMWGQMTFFSKNYMHALVIDLHGHEKNELHGMPFQDNLVWPSTHDNSPTTTRT
jgi:hypothetical protein